MSISSDKISDLKKILRKPHVNSTCIGCSACVAISGNVFELDDEWLSRVRKCDSYEGQEIDDSILACPVNAISWQPTTENGEYINNTEEHIDIAS